jgi:transposase-like protein
MDTTKRSYTSEERAMYIEQWKQSGLIKSEFARNHNISYTTFIHWISGRKKKASTSKATKDSQATPKSALPSFVSIQLETPTPACCPQPLIELALAGGHRINFYQAVSPEYIRSLLQ